MKDGSKVLESGGNIIWKNDKGEFHRISGPAIENINGSKAWLVNGKLHCEDGPAFQYANGINKYFLEGEEFTKEEYRAKMRLRKIKSLKNKNNGS